MSIATPNSINAFGWMLRKKLKERRKASSCKTSFSDILNFPISMVLSAKKADKESFSDNSDYTIFGL